MCRGVHTCLSWVSQKCRSAFDRCLGRSEEILYQKISGNNDSDEELPDIRIEHNRRDGQKIQELEELLARLERERDEENSRTRREVQVLQAERDDALTRLSALISSRLRNNNPNICDLSDNFRPTKLAEVSSELYDNEWTNANDILTEGQTVSGNDAIRMLLDIVLVTYQICKKQVDQQWNATTQFLGNLEDSTTLQLIQALKDQRKANVEKILPAMLEECKSTLVNSTKDAKLKRHLETDIPVHQYLVACVKLSLHMVVQDPPVTWYCPQWMPKYFHPDPASSFLDSLQSDAAGHSHDVVTGVEMTSFNKMYFREFMKSGNFVEFYVWPAMLLHDKGPLLGKGVAQGDKGNS